MAIIHEILPTDRADDTSAVHDAAALAAVLSVLADPTRLAILSHLRGGEHRVGELDTGPALTRHFARHPQDRRAGTPGQGRPPSASSYPQDVHFPPVSRVVSAGFGEGRSVRGGRDCDDTP